MHGSRRVLWARWSRGGTSLLAAGALLSAVDLAQAQSPQPTTTWGIQVSPPPAPPPKLEAAPNTQPLVIAPRSAPRAPNSTTLPRTVEPSRKVEPKTSRQPQIQLQALVTENGAPIDQGIVWRIYEPAPGSDGRHKLIQTVKESTPTLKLAPGSYLINAAYGRANVTRLVVVKPGEAHQESFVLNVGGIRLTATLASGETISETAVRYDVYGDARDQLGNRTRILSGIKPGLIVRLNSGLYHVVSTYGDANATERADVTVEAGKLTDVKVKHLGARITLKLVARRGGEAIADVRWQVLTDKGALVRESSGALPIHILQPGNYTAIAMQGERKLSQAFTVEPGETRQVEVIIP
ncbi:MAG: hypothetical protein F9K44_08400 [Hyphomicrobiaceae bacterium]|nr:MAG: hypothetical protein F9K44_08400 [Hyphomicrobiaceae bacterium]